MAAVREHGDYRRYQAGCRCTPCREGNNADARRRRRLIAYGRWQGRTNATGTIRRIRALATTGWSTYLIGAEIGVDPATLRDIARGERQYVISRTANAIADLYERWSTEDGPSKLSRAHARKQPDWYGPEAWHEVDIDDPAAEPNPGDAVDERAIRYAAAGDRRIARQLSDVERLHVTALLTERDVSAQVIGELFGVSSRTILRDRQVLRELEVAA